VIAIVTWMTWQHRGLLALDGKGRWSSWFDLEGWVWDIDQDDVWPFQVPKIEVR